MFFKVDKISSVVFSYHKKPFQRIFQNVEYKWNSCYITNKRGLKSSLVPVTNEITKNVNDKTSLVPHMPSSLDIVKEEFKQLNLRKSIINALEELEIQSPTEIQVCI